MSCNQNKGDKLDFADERTRNLAKDVIGYLEKQLNLYKPL